MRKIPRSLIKVLAFSFLAICTLSCTKSRVKSVCHDFLNHSVELRQLSITYPKNNSLFPIDFQSPTVKWIDSLHNHSAWFACISDTLGNIILNKFIGKEEWKPDSSDWEELKRNHISEKLQLSYGKETIIL